MKSNKYVIGILAHVDSGKTTLAESMLYQSGSIKALGRVDHRNTFLDTEELERIRGITIFSKLAQMTIGKKNICIVDTPGHIDFSAEMERTLQILDYAILVISGVDGIQEHTRTLWRLLKRYNIPVFIFVNKMDRYCANRELLIKEIQSKLDVACLDFSEYKLGNTNLFDSIAMCDEHLMNLFIEQNYISHNEIGKAIERRIVFPCFFGSALKQTGVQDFMEALDYYMIEREYIDEFGARVFKIARDDQNSRLTYMKITGGCLKVKSVLYGKGWNEKVDQLRIYSGNQYYTINEATAGTVCVVVGLNKTTAGEGIGMEKEPELPVLEPVLTYTIIAPKDCNVYELYTKLCILEEEEPQLHIVWEETLNQIHVQVMGEIQIEVLKRQIAQRYKIDIEFGNRNIVYKETISAPVIGIGHYEPLKHYAEVHLLMEPSEKGSGIEFATNCSEDVLDKNWQRLIMTHLEEKNHKGILVGAEITDIKISILMGKAHQKHTEGGDFRQATYRAVRNGLKKAQCVLLEPIYEFRLEIPQEYIGRAMSDLQQKKGKFELSILENDMAVLKGTAPVVLMQDYQIEVYSYSHGKGKLICLLNGYDVCHNANEIIEQANYDSESDLDNPTGSIFCAHGAGFYVEWNEVENYAHMNSRMFVQKEEQLYNYTSQNVRQNVSSNSNELITQEEIDEIFNHTVGNTKKEKGNLGKTINFTEIRDYQKPERTINNRNKEEFLLVDGYNIIFAWDELRKLSETNIDSARDKLMDILCNYQGYKKVHLILVFDAYKVHSGKRTIFDYYNIHVVYTKEAETADQFIEKVTNEMGKKYNITVATSDKLEQMIVWGQGAKRLSAMELWEEVEQINKEIKDKIVINKQIIRKSGEKNYLFDQVSESMKKAIEDIKNI